MAPVRAVGNFALLMAVLGLPMLILRLPAPAAAL